MNRCLPGLVVLSVAISIALPGLAQTAPSSEESQSPPAFINPKERLPLPALQSLNRLRFVTTVDFPPFNMLNQQGQLSGYNVDLAKALCSQLGIDAICQIEAVPWDELEERVLSGAADAIIGGWQPSNEKRGQFVFSRSYMRLPGRFVTIKSKAFTRPAVEATTGKTVGVISGTAHEQILKTYFPNALIKPYPDREAMLTGLMNGQTESVFDDGMSLSFWLNDAKSNECCHFTDGPYLAPQYLGTGFSIAVTEQNAAIAAAIDNGLQALQQKGVLNELYLRYFPTNFY